MLPLPSSAADGIQRCLLSGAKDPCRSIAQDPPPDRRISNQRGAA